MVVGAEASEVARRLANLGVRIVENPAWSEGMSTSIRAGLLALAEECDTVVLALADQPHVTPEHLRALAEAAAPRAATSYEGIRGAPCAFARSEFPLLLGLQGDAGARDLIRDGSNPPTLVPFEGAAIDVDTERDAQALRP